MPVIAGYELHAIEAGRFALDGGAMFGVVPRVVWARRHPPDRLNRIQMAMRCLLLVGHGRVILVDTGIGSAHDERFREMYAVDMTGSDLLTSLRAIGVAPDDVTDVILTHLHFDHGGGAVRRTAEGWETAFPRARYHVQKAHWEAASRPNRKEAASFRRHDVDALEASGQLQLLMPTSIPAPGLELVVVDGHTSGQQLVLVRDTSNALLYAADLIPTASHCNPLWNMAYDVLPLKSTEEKEHILRRAAENGWMLFFEHDPGTEVAQVEQTEKGFRATAPGLLADV